MVEDRWMGREQQLVVDVAGSFAVVVARAVPGAHDAVARAGRTTLRTPRAPAGRQSSAHSGELSH